MRGEDSALDSMDRSRGALFHLWGEGHHTGVPPSFRGKREPDDGRQGTASAGVRGPGVLTHRASEQGPQENAASADSRSPEI